MTSKPPCGVKDRLSHQPWPLSARRLMCILQKKPKNTDCVCVCVCVHKNNCIEGLYLCLRECNVSTSLYIECVCVFSWAHTDTQAYITKPERGISSPWSTFSRVTGSSAVWSIPGDREDMTEQILKGILQKPHALLLLHRSTGGRNLMSLCKKKGWNRTK